MAMGINKLATPISKDLYYDQGFRRHLEAYMGWLRRHPETVSIPINPHDVYKYEGDFYGLLTANQIPKEYHWVVMRVNDIYRSGNVPQEMTSLKIPEFGTLDRVMKMYRTKNKKNLT